MEFEKVISERAFDALTMLPEPTLAEIQKQRSNTDFSEVGIPISLPASKLEIAQSTFKKYLRDDLYGLLGLFYRRGDCSHSLSFVTSDARDDAAYKKIYSEGFEARLALTIETGEVTLYKAKRKKDKLRMTGIYIPSGISIDSHFELINGAVIFRKRFNPASLPVLEFALKKTLDLRAKYGENWYPFFSEKSLAKDMNESEAVIKEHLQELVGILCEGYAMKSMRVWQRRYFIPGSNYAAAEMLCR